MIDKRLVSQIQKVLSKDPNIKLAYTLGSATSGRTREDSDFDLGLVVENADRTDYMYIYKLLFPIKFPKDLDLSIVDKSSSPLFLFQIISTGQCVYQKTEEEKISFESFVLKNYYDTAHIRRIYNLYLKEKFPYASQ